MRRPKFSSASAHSNHDAKRVTQSIPQPLRSIFSGRNISLIVLASAVSASTLTFAAQPDPSAEKSTKNNTQTTTKSNAHETELVIETPADNQTESTTYTQRTNVYTDKSGAINSNTSASINAQDISVPENGSSAEIVTTNEGVTSVTISTSNTTSGSSNNKNSTTTKTKINQDSEQEIKSESEISIEGSLP